MTDISTAREEMVQKQIASRGVCDSRVLEAMRKVPREEFIDSHLREFAYSDHALPIAEDQTISQPYIVALMAEKLELKPDSKVLEIGAGSGYAAAILGELAGRVFTVERHEKLAELAAGRLSRMGYSNVTVVHGDGTRGLPDHAPFDVVVVAAGGPEVPPSLREQLKVGGKLLIPLGQMETQTLTLVERIEKGKYKKSNLGRVRFVPLLGEEGWPEPVAPQEDSSLVELIRGELEEFQSLDNLTLSSWLERVGDAKVVMLGESTHGTSEFYRMRARLTQELVEKKGFNMVCVEADWPDARQIDNFIKGLDPTAQSWTAFSRFPTWMWRNEEVKEFANWLRSYNVATEKEVSFFGLDLYSLSTSLNRVLDFLDKEYPAVAKLARHRYSCLTPWQSDPAAYGYAVLSGEYERCAPQAVESLLTDLKLNLDRDDLDFLDAVQNARLVANAERYYRIMYYGSAESWNLRDSHMFQTLETLLKRDPEGKAVVWEHNSHIGNAEATAMSARGKHNLGQLAREALGDDVYLVGFGTHSGKVAAATNWGGPMEVKNIRPSHPESYEKIFHEVGTEKFFLPLRHASKKLRDLLDESRLERAIGVIYRPETELASHYFQARLVSQFDEFIWFDETRPVVPLESYEQKGTPETYPFGL